MPNYMQLDREPFLQSVQVKNRINSRLPDRLLLKVTWSMTTRGKTRINVTLSHITIQNTNTKQRGTFKQVYLLVHDTIWTPITYFY